MNGALTAKQRGPLARGNFYGVIGGLLNHNELSFQDISREIRKSYAFCETKNCNFSSPYGKCVDYYSVRGLNGIFKIQTSQVTTTNCAKCGYALFWSNNYNLITPYKEIKYIRKD